MDCAQAVVMQCFGGPEVLEWGSVPLPQLGPRDVLVRVAAVSVNRTLDLAVRAGNYVRQPPLPHVLGTDGAGVVAEVGAEVGDRAVGDRVALLTSVRCGTCTQCRAGDEDNCPSRQMLGVDRWGSYADYVVLPVNATVLLPPGLPLDEATVIVRHAPTALHQLEDRARLKPGEWVLVMGAAGGLGSCLVQIARLNGGHVIAGAGSDERVQQCLANGAEFGVNYRAHNLAAEVARITDGHGADVVCENIADPTLWAGAFASLAYGGRLVTAGAHGGGKVELDVQRMYLRRLTLIGDPGNTRQNLLRGMQLAAAGQIRAVIDRALPLEEAGEAHRVVMANNALGKILLIPPQSPLRPDRAKVAAG